MLTYEFAEKLRKEYKENKVTKVSLAKKYNIRTQTVYQILNHLTFNSDKASKSSILTKEQVSDIKQWIANGDKIKDIAKAFNLEVSGVYKIKNGIYFKNIN